MTVAQCSTLDDARVTEVTRWRFSQLRKSGYSRDDAIALAMRREVDLHQAADLVARGCPPSLALRILL